VTDDLPGAVIESATIFGPGYPPAGAPLSVTPALPTDAATATFTASSTGVYPIVAVPLGHVTSRTYDVRGAMLTMTNAVGRTWTYSTTPSESVSSTPLGNTTTSTRTSYGLPGTTTLPGGATTGSTFDGNTQADETLSGLDSMTDLAAGEEAGVPTALDVSQELP